MVHTDEMPAQLLKTIKALALKENITDPSIESKVIPLESGNFMDIFREITVKGKSGDEEKTLELFVKTVLPNKQTSIYSVTGVFEKEKIVYRDVFKVFNELQDEAKVPEGERYNMIKNYDVEDKESMVMENLRKQGYTMCERMEVIPLKVAELSIQQLAKFHAMGFVIKAKKPTFFEEKVTSLKQAFHYDTPEWERFVTNATNISLDMLEPEQRKKVEEYLPKTFPKYRKFSEDSNSIQTIVHGDLMPNNVMLKKDKNGKVSEVMLIDFQGTFYGCPIIDFINFLFSGTDPEFRAHNMENLKNMYHDTLKQFLTLFGLDVKDYYPRSVFDKVYKERMEYGLMVSLWLLPINLAEEKVPDLTQADLGDFVYKVNETVKYRVRSVVDEFIKSGHL